MARVISDKPEGSWEHVCKKCHYRVEFHPGDIRDYHDPDEGERYRYVSCPKCHVTIKLRDPSALDPSDYDV